MILFYKHQLKYSKNDKYRKVRQYKKMTSKLNITFSILFFMSFSVKANVPLRTVWYKIKTNKSSTGYMSKTLSFNEGKFQIKSKIYNYDSQGFRIHETTAVSDKMFKPLSYEHTIKRSKNSKDNIVIKATFQDNVLSKTKTVDNQTFTRQDIIPQNTVLKDFLYLVLLNDNLNPNQTKVYNVLDNGREGIIPKIDPVFLNKKQVYSSTVLFKTSFGYTSVDKLGKIIFESNYDKTLALVRDMEALRNYFKVL